FAEDAAARERVLEAVARLTGMSSHPVAMALHAALTETRGTVSAGRITAFAERPHFGLSGTWEPAEGGSPLRLCVCRHEAWQRNPEEFRAQGLSVPGPEAAAPAGITPQSCLFINGHLAAFVVLGEEIKPGAQALLSGLAARSRPVLLLSGDHPERVEAFAQRAGFDAWRGALSPEQKQVEARTFQDKHGAALAVGDGYNDSLLFGEAA